MRWNVLVLTAATSVALWACGGEGGSDGTPADSAARDLSLAPAESLAAINDQPVTEAAPEPAPEPKRTVRKPRPEPPAPKKAEPRPKPKPAPPTIEAGTSLALWANDTLTSRHNKKGEVVSATVQDPITDARGRVVIPAGAVVLGTISDIAPAEHPGGQGRMVLTFNRVQFDGKTFSIQARTDSIGTFMKGRGITGGDAAKVGAGAVVGAIAGRIIGGNKKGTAIGAAVGAAAGTGIMAATRDVDIILPAGAPVRLILTAPFVLKPLQ